MHNVIMILNF